MDSQLEKGIEREMGIERGRQRERERGEGQSIYARRGDVCDNFCGGVSILVAVAVAVAVASSGCSSLKPGLLKAHVVYGT